MYQVIFGSLLGDWYSISKNCGLNDYRKVLEDINGIISAGILIRNGLYCML